MLIILIGLKGSAATDRQPLWHYALFVKDTALATSVTRDGARTAPKVIVGFRLFCWNVFPVVNRSRLTLTTFLKFVSGENAPNLTQSMQI
jgi:hypothetical protein